MYRWGEAPKAKPGTGYCYRCHATKVRLGIFHGPLGGKPKVHLFFCKRHLEDLDPLWEACNCEEVERALNS